MRSISGFIFVALLLSGVAFLLGAVTPGKKTLVASGTLRQALPSVMTFASATQTLFINNDSTATIYVKFNDVGSSVSATVSASSYDFRILTSTTMHFTSSNRITSLGIWCVDTTPTVRASGF